MDTGLSETLISVFHLVCLFPITHRFHGHSPSISCNFHRLQSCLFFLSMRANIANFMSSNSLFFTLCDACKQSYLLLIIWCSDCCVSGLNCWRRRSIQARSCQNSFPANPHKQETTFIAIVAVLGVSFFYLFLSTLGLAVDAVLICSILAYIFYCANSLMII